VNDELAAVLRTEWPQQDVAELTKALYRQVFASTSTAPASPLTEAELVRLLSAANQSHNRWIEGWRIEQVLASGAIIATRAAHRVEAKPGEYALTFTRDLRPRPGMAATLFFPRESLTLQQHVYYAFGDALPDDDAALPARIYFHAPVDVLPPLYERLTRELNALAIPFTMKSMLASHERDRRDGTVLYVPRAYASSVEKVIASLPSTITDHFSPEIPLFAKRLAPGIAIAETPGGSESFGMHRCRLLAEGILDARHDGHEDEHSRSRAVERRFRMACVDWREPHRNGAPRIVLTNANVVAWLGLAGGARRVVDCSSRNRNFAVVRAQGGGYFVKQLRVQGHESLRMMEREAALLGYDALRGLSPALVRFDGDAQVLVCELLPDAQRADLSEAFARDAARSLARLHRVDAAPLARVLDRQPPAIYTAHRGGPLMQWLGAGQCELIDRVRENQVLAPALDEMAAHWSGERLVHGDVKWENCLRSQGRIYWIDWELAAAGDPLWDVGCYVQAYLTHAVRTGEDVSREVEIFLREYFAATATERSDSLMRYAAARMIQSALEVMHGHAHPTPLALALLARSEALMGEVTAKH
jgi:hypothetical protein